MKKQISKLLQQRVEKTQSELLELNKHRVIEYHPQKDTAQIYFNHNHLLLHH